MVNLKAATKRMEKISFNNLKGVSKHREKIHDNSDQTKREDNPLFYCSLCSKHMDYSDLIDGCKCCFCDNDLFIILWSKYNKKLEGHYIKSTKTCRGYLI